MIVSFKYVQRKGFFTLHGMNTSIKGKEFICWASLPSLSQKEQSKAIGYIGRNGETVLKIYQKSRVISEISKGAE